MGDYRALNQRAQQTRRIKDAVAAAHAHAAAFKDSKFIALNPYAVYLPPNDYTKVIAIEDTMPIPTTKDKAREVYQQAKTVADQTKKTDDFIRAGIAFADLFAISAPGVTPQNPYAKYLYPASVFDDAYTLGRRAGLIQGGKKSRKGKSKKARKTRRRRA